MMQHITLEEGGVVEISRPGHRPQIVRYEDIQMIAHRTDQVMHLGDLFIDPPNRIISVSGVPIDGMTTRDLDVAFLLLSNVGRLVTRDRMRVDVFGNTTVQSRSIDTHVSRVRGHLQLWKHGMRIVSVYRHGYRVERVAQKQQRLQAAA